MAWSTLHWRSDILGKQTTAQVLLPETGDGPFQVFYLLHGLSDDSSLWLRRSRIEWYVRDLPLIVVMPDGYRSFYTKPVAGPDFAQHIGVELPAFIERHFHARPERSARAIGGLHVDLDCRIDEVKHRRCDVDPEHDDRLARVHLRGDRGHLLSGIRERDVRGHVAASDIFIERELDQAAHGRYGGEAT